MRNVEYCAGFVCQAVGNAQKRVAERHACEALGNVHFAACFFVAVVAVKKAVENIADGFQCQSVRKIAARSGNIGFQCVG